MVSSPIVDLGIVKGVGQGSARAVSGLLFEGETKLDHTFLY